MGSQPGSERTRIGEELAAVLVVGRVHQFLDEPKGAWGGLR